MSKVSFIIRSKNEESGLSLLLDALQRQTFEDFEVILVDSGSTDNTVAIAKKNNCKVIEITPESFTFGRALNIGLDAARGDIAILISAHCLPTDSDYLKNLVAPFLKEEKLAGVYGRQVPFSDASPYERRGLLEAYPPLPEYKIDPKPFFSNAHSAIQVSQWKKIPFDENLSGSEDIDWIEKNIIRGQKVCYQPKSLVCHSHSETLSGARHRAWRETLALKAINSPYYRKHNMLGYLLRAIRAALLDYVNILKHPTNIKYFGYWFFMIIPYRLAIYYGQYEAR